MLEIYLTPGHAPHHLCVFDRKEGVLLAGDMAGIHTDGFLMPGTPPPFRFHDYMVSLDKMIALKPTKLGYAHFGCYDNAVANYGRSRHRRFSGMKLSNRELKRVKLPKRLSN